MLKGTLPANSETIKSNEITATPEECREPDDPPATGPPSAPRGPGLGGRQLIFSLVFL